MLRFYAHSFVKITESLQELNDVGLFTTQNILDLARDPESGVQRELAILKAEFSKWKQELSVQHIFKRIERIENLFG